mgnify:CR=1 FL=1
MIVAVVNNVILVVDPVAVGVEGECAGDLLTVDRKGLGVEDVQRAGLDGFYG